ncbi:hypothetical protein AGMMS49592_3690 [Endomicrobiia bacterium]|nr:hypothetical protein AGMMS49592_3690 [Endomicrobiia bacterium]
MLEEIRTELQEKIPDTDHALWLDAVKEESFKNHILTLIIPNEYFIKPIETIYKLQIIKLIKENFNEDIEICLKIVYPNLPDIEPIIEKTETYQDERRENTTFGSSPNFKSQEEMELYRQEPKSKVQKDLPETQIRSMPGEYGTTEVISFTSLDGNFFTYPNDKRMTSKVDIKIKFANGKYTQYELYRGIKAFGASAVGQLTTNHAKILLAILHTWQKQGSRFAGTKDFAIVEISIRELAETLGCKKMSGAYFKWLYSKIGELISFPNLILLNKKEGCSFSFLSSVDAWSDKKDYNKTMLRLTFNPFISRQLYERRASLREPQYYKIKNPIAFKFLVYYDKTIYKSNKLKIPLKEVTKELQIKYTRTGDMAKTFKTAFKELDGYKLDKDYNLKVKLIKANKQYYVIAVRYQKNEQTAAA